MDFVITYSSLEHSGLGRYGDPLDPFGDIKEMRKIRCMLKPGGLLFLGLPMGPEVLGNNCHRIYGRIRLALMIEGFELLSFYYGNNSQPVEDALKIFSEPKPIHEVYHYVAVLRKI
ncbi:hypothetical protein Ddc_10798 [Ditylenchus destructor]|nr:hypothetical protein Ddc_10798 [Ditylenchus destructor]